MLLSCVRYAELVASSFAFASAFRFCTMASSSSVDMESASRGADVNDETVDLLLGLDVDTIKCVYEKPGSMKIGNYLQVTKIPIISDEEID